MSRNPYAPPTAELADPPLPVSTPRPREATLAMRLLWISWALSFAGAIVRLYLSWNDDVMVRDLGLVFIAINGAIMAWLIFKIARGRNWARITYTVLSLLGYASIVMSWSTYLGGYHGDLEWAGLDVLGTLADIGGIYLMFTRAANAWFRTRAASA